MMIAILLLAAIAVGLSAFCASRLATQGRELRRLSARAASISQVDAVSTAVEDVNEALRELAGACVDLQADVLSLREPTGMTGHTVRVSTIGNTVVQGTVHADEASAPWLVIRGATVEVVGSDAQAPAGGLIHIPRSHIDIVQQLPAEG